MRNPAVLLLPLFSLLSFAFLGSDAFSCGNIKCTSLNTAIASTAKAVKFTGVRNFRECFYKVALAPPTPKLYYFQFVKSRQICYGFPSCYYGYSSQTVLAGNIRFCPKPKVPPPPPPPPEPKYYCSNPLTGLSKCKKHVCPGSTKCKKRSSGPACCCSRKHPNPVIEGGLLVDCKK